jgi:hypothetical protein
MPSKRILALIVVAAVAAAIVSAAGADTPCTRNDRGGPGDTVGGTETTVGPLTVHRETGHYIVRNSNASTYVEVVGGAGYGSGEGVDDPDVRTGEGGYVEARVNGGPIFEVETFGPFSETDTTHVYGTSAGACVAGIPVFVCVGTHMVAPPSTANCGLISTTP